jgi:hypothetical protein
MNYNNEEVASLFKMAQFENKPCEDSIMAGALRAMQAHVAKADAPDWRITVPLRRPRTSPADLPATNWPESANPRSRASSHLVISAALRLSVRRRTARQAALLIVKARGNDV